jgi:hypothetical protein
MLTLTLCFYFEIYYSKYFVVAGNKNLKQVAKKSTSALPHRDRASSTDIPNGHNRPNSTKSIAGDVVADVQVVGIGPISSIGDNSHGSELPKESTSSTMNGRCSKTSYKSDVHSDADSDDVVVLSDSDADKLNFRSDRTKRSFDTAAGCPVASVNKKVCLEKNKNHCVSDKEKKFISRKVID